KAVSPAGAIGDPAAGLLEHDPARGEVPGLELPLPERVETPAGDPAEGERRRALPPHALPEAHRPGQELDVVARVQASVVREAGRQERRFQTRSRRDGDGRAVQPGPGTAHGAEGLLAHRIVHYPEQELVVPGEGDRDRELRVPVREVRRAV